MPDATLDDFEELAFVVNEGTNPILPRPEWGQSAAYLAFVIDGLRAEQKEKPMPADPYGPDEFAQSFQCHHGTTVATRDEYGCWTGHPCAACQAEAQR